MPLEVGGALRLRLEAVGRNHPPSLKLRRGKEVGGQKAVSLSVISYLLFGRSVAISCLDDFYDFYAFYDFYDSTNSLIF
jgi:hypothetical protein